MPHYLTKSAEQATSMGTVYVTICLASSMVKAAKATRNDLCDASFFFFFFFILRRMGKNKALAHHTSAYFHTRRVSI